MAEVDSSLKDADIDIGALFGSLRRNWLLIVGGALLMAALAWIICLLLTPDYRAETRIIIETRESVFTRPNGDNPAERPVLDPEGVKSQIEILTSNDLMRRVSDKLDLPNNEAFTSIEVRPYSRILILLGMIANPEKLSPDERVLQRLRKHLQVYNITGSRVIAVQYPLLILSWLHKSPIQSRKNISRYRARRSCNRMTMRLTGLRRKSKTYAHVYAMPRKKSPITAPRVDY